MLAYIEAKHTLYFEDDDKQGTSLAKACKQIRAVHALPLREPVSALQIRPYLSLSPETHKVEPRPGHFDHRNPLYCVVLARHAAISSKDKRAPTLKDMTVVGGAMDREGRLGPPTAQPAVIAAGEVFVCSSFENDGKTEVCPVMGPTGVRPHGSLIEGGSLGLAVMHMLWTIEQLELGPIPWDTMLAEAENKMKRR